MNKQEKIDFINHAIDVAKKMEEKTDKQVSLKIGELHNMDVKILINHPYSFLGTEEHYWNHTVVYDSIEDFEEEENDYLILNELIDKCQ